MTQWPTDPDWTPISEINKGNAFSPADGLLADDQNKIVLDLQYLYLMVEKLVKISHSDLLNLRNNNNLNPGSWYRIIDYVTTTSQAESQSANHAFDVIVLAIDTNKFDENAFAIQHDGDTYFANSKLEAWRLKYCIDNDTARFAWASSSGKGVIYELIDEFGNKCGYDFKNIQFKRYKVTACEKCPDLANGYYGARQVGGSSLYPSGATISSADTVWRYTFDANGTDASLIGYRVQYPLNNSYGCYGNEIYPYYRTTSLRRITQYLNNVVFLNSSTEYYKCYRNKLVGAKIYSNTFGDNCSSNTFGNDCISNTFGNECIYNTFGNNCFSNTFGNNCSSNTFGNDCNSNIFGGYCYFNTFGNDCSSNTFGNFWYSNTFSNYCRYSTFGNKCHYNIFGNDCISNTFGNECSSNTFGNNCNLNTLIDSTKSLPGVISYYLNGSNLILTNNTPISVSITINITGMSSQTITLSAGDEKTVNIGTTGAIYGKFSYTIRNKTITCDIRRT